MVTAELLAWLPVFSPLLPLVWLVCMAVRQVRRRKVAPDRGEEGEVTTKKKGHTMPYIPDKTMFKAVMFAKELRKTLPTGLAIARSAKYYKLAQADVAYWLGKCGGYKRAENARWDAYHEGEADGADEASE